MHSGNTIKFLAGNSHPELAQLVADRLGIALTPTTVKKFSNGETSVRIHDSVRDEDVFILQTACGPGCQVDDSLMELLILISACKTASARRITAVVPFYPYSRHSFKDKSRAPITAKLVANMLVVAGCDHLITMDLHASQIQGFFDIPVDNLYSEPVMVGFIRRWVPQYRQAIVVSPDAGGAKRASSIADRLGVEFALIHRKKERKPGAAPGSGEVERERMEILVGDVRGKIVILVDDMIDTGDTLALATTTLHDNGAAAIFVLVSHCTMRSDSPSLEKLSNLPIARIVVTNTLPQTHLMVEHQEVERERMSHHASHSEGGGSLSNSIQGSFSTTAATTDTEAVESPVTSSAVNGVVGAGGAGAGSVNGTNAVNGMNGLHRLPSYTGSNWGGSNWGGSNRGGSSTGRNTPNGFNIGSGVGGKLTVLDISPLLAESIRRTHNGESISLLFGDWAERAGMAGY